MNARKCLVITTIGTVLTVKRVYVKFIVALCNFLQTVSTTTPVRYFSTNLTMYILCQDLSIEQESTNIRFRVLGLSFNSRL